MKKRIVLGGMFMPLALVLVGFGYAWRWEPAGRQAKSTETDAEKDKLLATGKKIFVEKCAKCHDERGDKALKTGMPLSERGLSDEDIARAVSGRLKDAPDEEKRAVALYVSSFMKRK